MDLNTGRNLELGGHDLGLEGEDQSLGEQILDLQGGDVITSVHRNQLKMKKTNKTICRETLFKKSKR